MVTGMVYLDLWKGSRIPDRWNDRKRAHQKISNWNFQKFLAWGTEGVWCLVFNYIEQSWKVRGDSTVDEMVDKRSSQSALGAQVLASLVMVHKYFPVLSWCTSTSQFCLGTHALVSHVLMHKYWPVLSWWTCASQFCLDSQNQFCLGTHALVSLVLVHKYWPVLSRSTCASQSCLGSQIQFCLGTHELVSLVLMHKYWPVLTV